MKKVTFAIIFLLVNICYAEDSFLENIKNESGFMLKNEYYQNSKSNKINLSFNLMSEESIHDHFEWGNFFSIAPGIIIDSNKRTKLFLDFNLVNGLFYSKSIYDNYNWNTINTETQFINAYLLGKIKLIDISNCDLIDFKANWASIIFDFMLNKKELLDHSWREPKGSLCKMQFRISPKIGISSIQLGNRFKEFGKMSNETAFGFDISSDVTFGLLLFQKLLLSVDYNINPYTSNKGYYLFQNTKVELSYYEIELFKSMKYQNQKYLLNKSLNIFANYTINSIRYNRNIFNENKFSIGIRFDNFIGIFFRNRGIPVDGCG